MGDIRSRKGGWAAAGTGPHIGPLTWPIPVRSSSVTIKKIITWRGSLVAAALALLVEIDPAASALTLESIVGTGDAD